MNRRVFICFAERQRRLGGDLIAAVYHDAFQRLGFEAHISEIDAKGRNISFREFKPDDIAFILSDVTVRTMWDKGYWPKATNVLLNVECSAWPTEEMYRECWFQTKWHSIKRKAIGRDEGWQSSIYALFDFMPGGIHHHREHKIRAVFCPTGYSEKAELGINNEVLYDVSFLGQGSRQYSRRREIFRTLRRFRVGRLPGLTDQQIEQRWIAIKRLLHCQIWLHIHRKNNLEHFPCIRLILYGFSNRRCVVSEPCVWAPPFVDGVHWIVSSQDDLPQVIKGLITNRRKTEDIGNVGYEFVKRYWRQEDHLKKALQEADLLCK